MNQGAAKPTGEVTMQVIRGNGPRQKPDGILKKIKKAIIH